jgi:hypothetical protein
LELTDGPLDVVVVGGEELVGALGVGVVVVGVLVVECGVLDVLPLGVRVCP